MAKPFKPAAKPVSKPAVAAAVAAPAARSEVRNSPLPRPASPISGGAKKEITRDMIAKRAYEIWQSGAGGSEYDNWIRAERELRGGM